MNFQPNAGSRLPCVYSLWATIVVLLPVAGCALFGVEPDEIDLAMGTESEAVDETGGAGGSEGESEGADTNATDGGDGDGDTGTGDGDGDPANETDCSELGASPLVLGANDVMIDLGASVLEGSCGQPGPEQIFSYVADEAVNLGVTLTGFDAALYAIDGLVCLPLVEASCVNTPDQLTVAVQPGQLVHVVVDAAAADGGSGTLDVVVLP